MNWYLLIVNSMFFMNHVSVIGMQEVLYPKIIDSKIVRKIKSLRTPLAIAFTPAGKLIVLDEDFCIVWNYKEQTAFQVVPTKLNRSEISINNIYAHPKKDIFIIPKYAGADHTLYNYEDNVHVFLSHFKNKNSNVLCSDFAGFYVIKDNCLIRTHTIWPASFELKEFSPSLLFAALNRKESCFLCCDEQETGVYKLHADRITKSASAQKLFDFCTQLDLAHWTYDPVGKTLYAITHDSRQLYAADIETHQQEVLSKINDFEIGTLALVNDRILVLLAKQWNKLCYIDIKKRKPLLITMHTIAKENKQNASQGQKMAVADGNEVIIAYSDTCFGIIMPSWIREFDVYEKYREIIRRLNIPKELRWLIAIELMSSIIIDKKNVKKYHEIE